MKRELKLTVTDFISVNHYTKLRSFITYHNGKPKANAVKYVTAEANKAKERIAKYAIDEVRKQDWSYSENRFQHYYLDCVFYFPRIDMDDQNHYKIVTDAMNGIVFIDDSSVLVRTQRIYYDSKNPRIEITVHEVDYIGIFDNKQLFNEFNNKCSTCTRGKKNCSIKVKAIEGRIQDEITQVDNQNICSKYKQVKE